MQMKILRVQHSKEKMKDNSETYLQTDCEPLGNRVTFFSDTLFYLISRILFSINECFNMDFKSHCYQYTINNTKNEHWLNCLGKRCH